jgi:hypothetical protein
MSKTFAVLEMMTIGFGFAAAWFWFRSSQSFATEIDYGTVSGLKDWFGQLAYYNHAAALCAALSALGNGLIFLGVRVGL